MSEKHWITTAIHHHGALRKMAHAAGKSTAEFAREHEHSPGLTGQRSRLAITLMGMSKKKGGK